MKASPCRNGSRFLFTACFTVNLNTARTAGQEFWRKPWGIAGNGHKGEGHDANGHTQDNAFTDL